MNESENGAGAPTESKYPAFFELLRMRPDPRVEKVIQATLSRGFEQTGSPHKALGNLLSWKQQFNVLVIDSGAGWQPKAGRTVIVLDDGYLPLPGIDVRASTGEHGTTDEHGRVKLCKSWEYCKLTIARGGNEGSIFIDRVWNGTERPKEQALLYILTDLDQYRPSQAIHVRGITWHAVGDGLTPVKAAIAIVSLVNAQSVEVTRQRLATDDFGVFDLVIETDFMIREGPYKLRFEFPEYKHIVEKPITIKNFTPPTVVIEVIPNVDVEHGKDIQVPVRFKYYYGDPVAGGRCNVAVCNASGAVTELELVTAVDGSAMARIPTVALEPGNYEVSIVGHDPAGRVATAMVRANVWKKTNNEALAPGEKKLWRWKGNDPESHDWSFTASIDGVRPGKCNIMFVVEHPTPSWYARPSYIFWISGRSVIASDVLYPSHSASQDIDVPPDASGLVTVTIVRVDQNGQYRSHGRLMFVIPKDRTINMHVDCPGEARPGDHVSLGLSIDPPHDRKQIEVGAMLVDKAVRGRDVPAPFSEICQVDRDGIYVHDSWTSQYSDLARELDRFIGDVIRHIDKYAFAGLFNASDMLHLLQLVEKSKFCGSEFISHHVTSLCCTCGNQPPADVVMFILDYLRAKYSGLEQLATQLAWFPTILETWTYLITPENPLVVELVAEFPGALETILARSIEAVRKARKASTPADFEAFYSSVPGASRPARDFPATLNDVEQFLEARIGPARMIALKRSGADSSGMGDQVTPKRPIDPDSMLCIDQLADILLADQVGIDRPRFRVPVIIGYPKYTSIMTDVGGGTPVPSPFGGKSGDQGPVVTVRTYFPDCGYWNPRILVDGGKASVKVKIPDTITEQNFIVQGTSLDCDAGMATKPILVRQEFFIQPDIPPHLVYGDVVGISAVVTNRTAQAMAVDVSLDAEGFKIASSPAGKLQVASNGVVRVSWTLHATACGEKHLVFTAAGKKYKDVVDQVIFVHPEGEPDVKITRGTITAGRVGSARLVVDVASSEMAHYARLSIIPDRSSLALDGLEAMLQYPHGCVEQTMSSVLPNLLVYESLKATNRLTARYKVTCEDMIAKGLQRLLSFRHDDGGWGWWEQDPTNLFMTGYVLRGILKMKALGFHAPQDVIVSTLAVIAKKQTASGSWLPEQALRWDKVAGKDALLLNEAGMTAWILLCISETGDWRVNDASMVDKAIAFLGPAIDSIAGDSNALALAGLAIHRLAPNNPSLPAIGNRLEKLKTGPHWNGGSALGGTTDATAKALHFMLLLHSKDIGKDVDECVGWILGSRTSNGGWGTTIATASVVEAILAMPQDKSPAVDGDVVVNGHARHMHVDTSNLAEEFINLRDMNVTRFLVPGKNEIDIRLASSRPVQYQISEEAWSKECLAGGGAFAIERAYSGMSVRSGDTITVSVKVSASQSVDQCVVIEERIPAGFRLDIEAFENSMRGNEGFEHFMCRPDKIVLYPRSANSAFTYALVASRAFSGTHAGTEVYAMYSPADRGRARPVALEVRKI